jgi:hypothetical protein
LFEQPNVWFHAHGVVLTLWCVMLVVQAQLVRTGRRALHRRLGKASYALAPALVLVTTVFVHQRVGGALQGVQQLPAMGLHFLALTLVAIAVFALFYALAIYYRRNAQLHARYMICTVFPLVTPVTDRLIGAHFRPLIDFVPRIEGNPILPVAGFALADLLLLALAVWDWRVNERVTVFPVALGVLVAYHVGVLTLHRVPAWNAFCVWFLGLPMS